MSDSLIRSTRIGSIYIQSGHGVPTHINVIGSLYVDQNDAILYINKDGVNDWQYFLDSGQSNTGTTVSGLYLPLSGGTLTGGLVANSGVTASTISQTTYIDFTTGSTNPSAVGGRVFFDNTSKALSYYDIQGNNVAIAMGQQLYTRVWNATGAQIDKGKVISITGTSNGLPSAILSVNTHAITSARPIGLAAENIPNNSEGLVLNNGILSGITLNTFANGDVLYLSDTTPGLYVNSTASLAFTARTNEIGYVLQTGSTTGKIYVNINNEDSNLSLTDIERNILEGNVISTGAYEYSGATVASTTTINVSKLRGWIVRNTYTYATLPDVTNVYYTGGTNIPITNIATADATYLLITSANTLTQQTTFPTPQERRQNIFIGKVVHPNRSTILNINQTVDFDVSPMSAIRDIWTPIKLINQGVVPSAYSAGTLTMKTSAGALWGNGIGWTTNQLNPDSVSIPATAPTTFQYRTATGGTFTNTTTIDSTNYDPSGLGVIANVPGAGNFTTQRIYLFPTGLVRVQYGQSYYPTLAKALAGLPSEQYIEFVNNRDNGILIGFLTVKDGLSDLTDTNDAFFTYVSKFGELFGGTAGISTTTLQQAYDNSSTPEIVINAVLDGLSVKNGTGNADNVTNNFEVLDAAGATTAFLRADGYISGTTLKTDGFIANSNGLTATTISATTYHNLPLDIRVTGGTYSTSASTITFRNNTGGTFNVTGITATGGGSFTGGTVTGATFFTGGLSANTISATTYHNLPLDIRVTGGTYTAGTASFTNNTGGTFSVTGFSKYFVSGSTPSGVTINNGDRWFDTTNGVELVYFNDGDSSQWVQTNDSATITGDYLPLNGGTVTGATTFTAGLYSNIISATTYQNLPTDIRVTGATYSNNTFTYTNNTGGTFNVLFNTLTGLTVNGNLTVTGTTSSGTISATTYQNLPTDIRVTGASYNNNTFTYTNNTGGTFNVLFNTLTGLTINGDLNVTGSTISPTHSGTTFLSRGAYGLANMNSSNNLGMLVVSGSGTVGGANYVDFIRVVNTAAGATNPNKTIRVNNAGGIEFLNSAYTAQTLSLSDNGILYVGGGNIATTSSNDATKNYLSFNTNNSQIYDDGNFHIHSRGSGQAMWINSNNGSIIIGNQSPTSGGAAASSIIMGSGSTTARAYVNIYDSKTYSIGSYGFLYTGGAGTGGGTTGTFGLYVQKRIEAEEFDATSDERLKDIKGDIELEDAIKLVNNLKPIKYTWKDRENEGIKAGYSAQQVEKAGFKHLISHIPNEDLKATTDDEGFTSPEGFQFTMNYDQVTPYHGVVIKHLLEEIEKLKNEIKDLQNKIK